MKDKLSIDAHLDEILNLVKCHQNVILTATPGAGKTTRLPPYLLSLLNQKILVLQPRRMAAIAAAHHVAREQGWSVGEEVGYQVRFDSKVNRDRTRLIFMTDGLMLRRLVEDPELLGVDLLVLDEFHERTLNQDLILGYVRELQEMGSAVRLLVMSATMDAERLLGFLPGAASIDIPGQRHELTIRYDMQGALRTDSSFFQRMESACLAAARETAGDVLAFLPGTGEIRRLAENLRGRSSGRKVCELHGSISLGEQQEILRASEDRRIILATNVAEASVTVSGVNFVVDSGLAKVMSTHLQTGFSSLALTRISMFNARQRAGRAARQGPGVCWRLWSEHEEVTQAEAPVPECQRVDLSSAVLLLAHLGVSNPMAFAWLETPPPRLMDHALRYLRFVGAVDSTGKLTPLGVRLIEFPLPPRWGALLAFGEREGWGSAAAELVALLSEGDLRREGDILDLWEEFRHARGGRSERWRNIANQLKAMVGAKGAGRADFEQLRRGLLRTQKDRLCRRRGKSVRGVMVGGRGVEATESLLPETYEFFLALEGFDAGDRPDSRIPLRCGLPKDLVLQELADEIREDEDVHFDEATGQFHQRRARKFLDLILEEPTLRPIREDQLGERLVDVLVGRWDAIVAGQPTLSEWMARWEFVRQQAPQFEALNIREALALAAFGETKIARVLEKDLRIFLEQTLGRTLTQQLNEWAPREFHAPSGRSHSIHYKLQQGPYVEVRLQEIFGLQTSPRLANNKIPLTFHLLGPNYRPVQVTSDLANFWKVGYFEVRKELRARYPKHAWPEDPLSAQATHRTRR